MKKALIIIGIFAAANILYAQDTRREKAEVKIEEYKERLNLTDEQSEKLKELREKYKPEMEAIRDDDSKSRSEKMRAAADVVEKRELEVEAILDEDQLAELAVIKKEVKANMKERRKKRRDRRSGN